MSAGSTYIEKTLGTPTNNKIWTFSCWVKRANRNEYGILLNADNSRDCIRFRGNNNRIQVFFSEVSAGDLETTATYRDINGWMHVVLAVDTTQAVASNRVKLYMNGEQVTSWATETYPAQDYVCKINSAINHRIGKDFLYAEYLEGVMSHIHFTDGTQYAASDFGELDSSNGQWKIKTTVSVTYGNNGFFILKNSNSLTDQSGNSNNWSVGAGTFTNTEDNPSDNYATLNALVPETDMTYVYGNTRITRTSASWDYAIASLGADKGKYYFEGKIGGTGHWIIGVTDNVNGDNGELGNGSGDVGWRDTGDIKVSNSSVGSFSTYTSSDVVCVAMDKTNNKVYFRKNDSAWENSGDPTSGATGTGGFNLTNTGNTYFPAACMYITSGTGTFDINFGNGYFGTTVISSEGTNASGIGKFEYDVPAGYCGLSTKGLNN